MSRDKVVQQIFLKACRLCARQEKAPSQIHQKLLHYGATAEEADELLTKLQREGFVDVDRFTRAYVSDKFRFNKWGKIKIAYQLRGIGIAEETVAQAMTLLDPVEYEAVARHVAKAKFTGLGAHLSPLERQKKTLDFLRGRGFEFDLAKKISSNLSFPEQS
ncbi:MAG: regulatory protein RecX [Bacteroidota bacterium]